MAAGEFYIVVPENKRIGAKKSSALVAPHFKPVKSYQTTVELGYSGRDA